DKFISPTAGCQLFFNTFNNPTNVFREYSISHGDLDDYTHSRIMISRNAAKEIWPTVVAWVDKHTN
ncbi:alpha/beta fold hydrolase, partial [Psychrobacter sp. 1U2]